MQKAKKRVFIVVLVMTLLVVAGVLWQWKQNKDTETLADGTINCGKHSYNEEEPYSGCFENNFSKCNPAQIILSTDSKFDEKEITSALNGLTVMYKIKSKQDNSCLIEFQYLANEVKQEWNNKPVVCPYSLNTTFAENIKNADASYKGCNGPLIEEMNKL